MRRLSGRLLGSCAILALPLVACRDAGTAPRSPRNASINLAPRFQAGAESALPIDRIRVTAFRVLDEPGSGVDPTPLASRALAVVPTDEQWEVALDVPVSGGAPLVVQATVELINVAAGSVEWSGRSAPVSLSPGLDTQVESVPLGRGSLANLLVQGVAIRQLASLLALADSTDASAMVTPAVAGATVFWGTLDPAIASVTPAGRVHALALGTARITATAGLHADTGLVAVVTPATTVTSLVIEAGNAQTATVATAVAIAPRVAALNVQGARVAGVPVVFTVASGGGNLGGGATSVTVTTGADGTAQVPTWVLGQVAGANGLRVGITGSNVTATFTATGVAGAAQNIVVVSGNDQEGTAGIALGAPIVARVRDQFLNPVAGVVVTFASPQGGLFAPAQATSNTFGLVQSTWTPSFSVSTQVATATAAGVATPATFTAFVFIPPR